MQTGEEWQRQRRGAAKWGRRGGAGGVFGPALHEKSTPGLLSAQAPALSESPAREQPKAEAEPVWEERILWNTGEDAGAAYFLPQRALEGLPLADLPVREEDMALLRQAFRLDGAPEWPPVLRADSPSGEADEAPECLRDSREWTIDELLAEVAERTAK